MWEAKFLRPLRVRSYRDAADLEGGEHLGDVPSERFVEDDDEHLVRAEPPLVLESEVSEPVEPDRRLAAASAALNDDETRVLRRDELELPRVDEPGDLLQVLVFGVCRVVTETELAGAMVLLGPERRSLAAGEPRPFACRRHSPLSVRTYMPEGVTIRRSTLSEIETLRRVTTSPWTSFSPKVSSYSSPSA